MPRIIPIRDLKDTVEISRMCHEEPDEPIMVTKNGYMDMVIVSPEFFDKYEDVKKRMWLEDVYKKLEEGEQALKEGKVIDAREHLRQLREKYAL